jgi:hypothetical protein
MTLDSTICYRARCTLRRTLFRRRVFDAHLLPTGLHREAAQIRELPILSERRRSGSGRVPALSALSARTRAGQCQRGRDDASGAGSGEFD